MIRTNRILVLGLGLSFLAAPLHAATLLPVGPLVFDSHPVYDDNFRTDGLDGISRTSFQNYGLRVASNNGGAAVFDQSSTGGSSGKGGTSGSQENNDLSDFTISANVFFNGRTTSNVTGFFLRLDDNDDNGYLATVELSTNSATVRLYEGVGITAAPDLAQQVYSETTNTTFAISEWYRFSVTVKDNTFSFDFDESAFTASYTDLTPTRSIGQTGVYLSSGSEGTSMNHLQITAIPEPSALLLMGIPAAVLWFCGRGKPRRKP